MNPTHSMQSDFMRPAKIDPNDLFKGVCADARRDLPRTSGAIVLPGFARPVEEPLLCAVFETIAQAPLRHMLTPGGRSMAVAMSNCGALGWIGDRHGYRYAATDPLTGHSWPAMPRVFSGLATTAAARAGYDHFMADACLINCYVPGTRLSLHQDRDERDFSQPIVSVSLGLSVVFLFGGLTRAERPARMPLAHGDVVVWGGVDRQRFHGVMPLKPGCHPQLGEMRINLTFRKAG